MRKLRLWERPVLSSALSWPCPGLPKSLLKSIIHSPLGHSLSYCKEFYAKVQIFLSIPISHIFWDSSTHGVVLRRHLETTPRLPSSPTSSNYHSPHPHSTSTRRITVRSHPYLEQCYFHDPEFGNCLLITTFHPPSLPLTLSSSPQPCVLAFLALTVWTLHWSVQLYIVTSPWISCV